MKMALIADPNKAGFLQLERVLVGNTRVVIRLACLRAIANA